MTVATLKPRTTFAYLMLLDGRCLATNHYGPCGLSHLNQWGWVCGYITREFDCDENAVSCVETDDGDFIAVDGLIIGYLDLQR